MHNYHSIMSITKRGEKKKKEKRLKMSDGGKKERVHGLCTSMSNPMVGLEIRGLAG